MNDHQDKRRAILRIILGNAQMVAAIATLVMLWLGKDTAAIAMAGLAGALLLTSIILFRVVMRQ
ncbi:MAG TPA: hypothetical protein VFE47_21785 [Tepidisphaeraceae bacterium]|jgi:hypothetical protein|nr:hypothetical protein [Tepidisphaeraceae bacterium]